MTDPAASASGRPAPRQTDPDDRRSGWPRVGVGIVILREGGAGASGPEILIARRGRAPRLGEWSLPGGRQEAGETLFQTAAREAAEETGVVVRPVEVITAIDSITRDDDGAIAFHYTLVEVLAEWQSGDAVAGDDADEVAWIEAARCDDWLQWDVAGEVVRRAVTLWQTRRGRGPRRGDIP